MKCDVWQLITIMSQISKWAKGFLDLNFTVIDKIPNFHEIAPNTYSQIP